tara:strand:- start:98 stop:994 length:897 start_codon:yes stop_codon:yes gene_type:complete
MESISLSIILGILFRNLIKVDKIFKSGINFTEKHILSLAVVFLGVKLDYLILSQLGIRIIFFIITGIVLTILFSLLIGKIFNLNKNFALLLGIGNGICGSSAIAATQKIIGVRKEEIGLSITIINLLGTIGFFLLPFLGSQILEFTDLRIGVLIGNTLQSLGQVVASGFSISDSVGQTATIVKMVRILMLSPLIIVLLFIVFKSKNNNKEQLKFTGIPIFIYGFILFSLISTFHLLPLYYIHIIERMSYYLLIVSMVGVGLKISFNDFFTYGKAAFIVGSFTFMVQVILTSIGIISFL